MFGKVLKEAREAAGLTQEKLAFRAGLDRTYISLMERGLRSPTLDVLLRLCEALGILPSELMKQLEIASKIRRLKGHR
jgi:transcriptional regulator with XRE-family HTH domain